MSRTKWRMEAKCATCPFHEEGPGRRLRDSLMPGRFAEILSTLERGGHFHCHSTIDYNREDESGEVHDPGALLCAGSLQYQSEAGASSQMQRIMERLDWISERRAP